MMMRDETKAGLIAIVLSVMAFVGLFLLIYIGNHPDDERDTDVIIIYVPVEEYNKTEFLREMYSHELDWEPIIQHSLRYESGHTYSEHLMADDAMRELPIVETRLLPSR